VCMGTHVHSAIDGYVSIYKRKELIGYLQNWSFALVSKYVCICSLNTSIKNFK
jgi:hypothetical protein